MVFRTMIVRDSRGVFDAVLFFQAHLMKHRNSLHKTTGLTEAQQSILDHILLEKIKARKKVPVTRRGTKTAM